MLKFVLPVLFCLFFLVPSAFGQEKSCVITLKNGNTISADSCRVKGGRIYLKYPLGEVSFELSQVKSITGGNGGSSFFQDKGKAQAAGRQDRSADAEPPDEAQAEKDSKFNDFFDKYWQADEKTQAKMDKQMDKVFSDYFDSSDSSDASDSSDSDQVPGQLRIFQAAEKEAQGRREYSLEFLSLLSANIAL